MVVRFFILQSHYRSPLDFSSEALTASEKALKRLWEAYDVLKKLEPQTGAAANPSITTSDPALTPTDLALAAADPVLTPADPTLDEKVNRTLLEFDEFMSDDFNTAKVLASMFELTPVINSIRSGHIAPDALSGKTLKMLKTYFFNYLEKIFGLKDESAADDNKLTGVVDLLIDIRKDARKRKDYATSDKIRNQLLQLGIVLKDEKDGGVSYTFS